jgi:hypothetical protein
MGEAAMQNRVFRSIVGQRSHRIAATSQHQRYYWKNTNLQNSPGRATAAPEAPETPDQKSVKCRPANLLLRGRD